MSSTPLRLLQAKEGCDLVLVEVGADHAQATDNVGTAHTDIHLLGNVVKVEPLAVLATKDTLGAKHLACLAAVKCGKNGTKRLLGVGLCGLLADAGKDLVGVVVVVVMMLMSATAFMIMVVMMLMSTLAFVAMVVMLVSALAFVVVVVMVPMSTLTFAVLVVMMFMSTLTFVVMVGMMLMSAFTFVVMVVMVLVFVHQLGKLCLHRPLIFHRRKQILAVKLLPRRSHDDCLGIFLAKKSNCRRQLVLTHTARAAEYDGIRMLDLVVIKLAKILHIHTALGGIGDCNGTTQHHILAKHVTHRAAHVRKLAHTRGLNENTVGRKALQHLHECLSKVTHERTADATAVHFGDLDARLAQKAAVDADLAKFVLNENHLLVRVGFLQQFFDERGLARSQKA